MCLYQDRAPYTLSTTGAEDSSDPQTVFFSRTAQQVVLKGSWLGMTKVPLLG